MHATRDCTPRGIRLRIHALRIKAKCLPVPLSLEIIITLFLEVLRDLFLFLMRYNNTRGTVCVPSVRRAVVHEALQRAERRVVCWVVRE
jgi:hypothetical protein